MSQTLSRRGLTTFSAALIGTSALAACAGRTQDQLAADVNLLATGLSGVVAALQNASLKIPADIITQAQAAIDDIKSNAAAIGSALTPNANAVQAIGSAVSALSALLAPFFPVAPIVGTVVQAALALIPTILAFIHVTPPAKAAAAAGALSADDARAVLRAAPVLLRR